MTAKTTPRRPATTRRTTGRKTTTRTKQAAAQPPVAADAPLAATQELRDRWASARRVVQEAVGREDEHDPCIWERGVYQLWLWLVVERLVVRRDEIDVSELSVISKMLTDQRKLSLAEAKQHGQSANRKEGNGAARSTQLPPHFGEIVRQIYGTNFQDDAASAGTEPRAPGAENAP